METVRAGVGEGEAAVDDDLAAQYLRDFLLIVYSHPSVTGVQMWGMWDQVHWKKNALIYAPNWKLKPTGTAYVDLVFNEWWTDEQVQTSAAGTAKVRGFLGAYRITATQGGRTGQADVVLGRQGDSVTVQLK